MLRASILFGLLLLTTACFATPQEDAAKGVLNRLIGNKAKAFRFQQIERENGLDVFEVQASNGKVTVKGSTGVAMARGAYEYIKNACHRQVTWDNWKVDLPSRLPDMPAKRVVCPNKYRHYFNVCTFGYTTVWWKWDRWQREIDWMALHGINMPLAMNGQEAVWKQVFLEMGVPEKDIDAFFTGPAFLTWHRMGNCDGHAGPLPKGWLEGQVELQKKILKRERELGMTPVTPGFSGFVPAGFAKVFPKAKLRRSSGWCGFEPTYILDANDPLFREVGRRFVQRYIETFGTDHLYLCDTFNEMRPQVNPATKLEELQALGKAVYSTILAGDPEGVWVMQGWLFLNDKDFWGVQEASAMLTSIPNDRMVIFDLGAEIYEAWRNQPAMREKQWIWCALHNFGQNTTLWGDLNHFAQAPIRALNDPGHGNMAGMGTTPEGIENNAVVYELVTDTMWRTTPLNVDEWIGEYARQRYGSDSPQVRDAWKQLYNGYYKESGSPLVYTRRPTLGGGLEAAQGIDKNKRLTETFLRLADDLQDNPAYLHDLVDVEKRFLQSVGSLLLDRVYEAYDEGNRAKMNEAATAYLRLLDDLDRLLATRPEYRLSRWTEAARSWGQNAKEKSLYEQNARLQVTVWGNKYLYDYANKEWSGLTSSFYKERWRHLFKAMAQPKYDGGKLFGDLEKWELAWCMELPRFANRKGEGTVAVARSLFAKYGKALAPQGDIGIAVGCPVSDSGHIEGAHGSRLIVDGIPYGDYWSAYPYPQWVQIDLGKARRVDAIHVIPYYSEPRYYQYTVEVSLDGVNWALVGDMRKNTKQATRKGDRFAFEPVEARFVRVTMLFNSANPGVHLHEVRVFKAK